MPENLALAAAVLLLGVGGVMTAISGIRAAFVRVPDFDLGSSIDRDECPELWALAEAVDDLRGAVAKLDIKQWDAPNQFSLHLTFGTCLARVGRFEEAIDAFTDALGITPTSLAALVERGRAHAERKGHLAALADFTKAMELWPTAPEAPWERAKANAALGRTGDAERDRAAALAIDARVAQVAEASGGRKPVPISLVH